MNHQTIPCPYCSHPVRPAYMSRHVGLRHSDVDPQSYYDEHVRRAGEGSCRNCGNPTRFLSAGKGYAECCSQRCAAAVKASDPAVRAKIAASLTATLATAESKAKVAARYTPEVRARMAEVTRQRHAAGAYRRVSEQLSTRMTRDKDHFLTRARQSHPDNFADYDYDESVYRGVNARIEIRCLKHGVFEQWAGDHAQGANCPKCVNTISKPETGIADYLESLGAAVVRRDRIIIAPFELDIVLPEQRVAIEYCGLYWHSEQRVGKRKHLDKLERCNAAGYRLITIFEDEWLNRPAVVRSKLARLVGDPAVRRVHARQCRVELLERGRAQDFLERYHLQGADGSPVRYGLVLGEELIAVATFGRPSIAGGRSDCDWNVGRYAVLPHVSVPGGWQKILKCFIAERAPQRLLTYADRRWSDGDVYGKSGFAQVQHSAPNYWYFRSSDPARRHHRYGFRKSELAKKLASYDPSLTEHANMDAAGWLRVWDCGNTSFVLDLSPASTDSTITDREPQ